MPCIVKHGLTDEDVLALQIQANALRPETTAVEYARQIKVVAEAKPGITLAGLSQIDSQESVLDQPDLGFAGAADGHPKGCGSRGDSAWFGLHAVACATGSSIAVLRPGENGLGC